MEGFYSFDLQTLGEIKFIFEQLRKTGTLPVEQKNKAEFYARYCLQLQARIKKQIEAGGHHASSHI